MKSQLLKKLAFSLFMTVLAMIFISCGIEKARVTGATVTDAKLVIKSPVTAETPYPAIFTIPMPAQDVNNIKGYFFWNSEGPFPYPATSYKVIFDRQKQKKYVNIKFMLYTGRANTYNISGYITYREKSTGKLVKTIKVSAGNITVNPIVTQGGTSK